jgi:nitroreductase
MTLDQLLRSRRSIRSYQPREVGDALITEILDLARYAPSSMNSQPCCFVVIRNADAKRRLALLKNAYCPREKRAYAADFLATAPVVVAVCVEKGRAHDRERENGVLATAHLLLAAHQRGLGGVYLSAYQPHDGALAAGISRELGLPPEVEPVTLVPLGFPAETPPAKEMRPLADLIHHERWAPGELTRV